MDANELPSDVEELKALLLQTHMTLTIQENELQQVRGEANQFQQQATQFEQQAEELARTVAQQQKKLESKEHIIRELLAALRGKTRERIDPDQLLLFEIGELETLIQEELNAEQEAARPKRKRKRGRRLIPDNIPTEIIEHTLPEADRLCPIDGQPMPMIRWEESTQLDFVPPKSRSSCTAERSTLARKNTMKRT